MAFALEAAERMEVGVVSLPPVRHGGCGPLPPQPLLASLPRKHADHAPSGQSAELAHNERVDSAQVPGEAMRVHFPVRSMNFPRLLTLPAAQWARRSART